MCLTKLLYSNLSIYIFPQQIPLPLHGQWIRGESGIFALLFSNFTNKVNLIVIQCLDFAVEGLHYLKNYLITEIEAKDMEEKIELCSVKLSSSYEMPLVIIKEFET